MLNKCTIPSLLILLLPHVVFAQQNATPPAPTANVVDSNPEGIPPSEIYDVTLNNNWKFSGLITFDKDNFFIPLKYLPSEVLGNLTESNMVEQNGRSLRVARILANKIDSDNLVLTANLSEAYFKTQLVSTDALKQKQSTPINALFMNYDLNIPLEAIGDMRGTFDFNWASKNNWVAKSGLLWDGSKAILLNSSWQKQYDDKSLLVFGDTSSNTISGFNSLNFLGFRYASAYYNSPAYINGVLPTIPISGFAVNPSKLDLYLNNQLIQSSEINSGKYNLNYPLQRQGYGLAQAFVYDLTGKPVVVSVPFYGNNEVIKAGEHAYDVSGGMIRKNFGTDSFNYESFVVNGLYKRGITEGYTQDFFAQYSPIYSVVSTKAHWIPHPQVGVLHLGYSHNSLNQKLVSLGMERSTPSFSFGGSIDKSSSFCYGFDQACVKKQVQFYTGIPLPAQLGTVTANYVSRENNLGKNDILGLQWNKQLTSNINLFANVSKTKNTNTSAIIASNNNSGLSFYVGLSINLGGGVYSNTSVSKAPGVGTNIQEGLFVSERLDRPELGYGSLTYSKNAQQQEQTANVYYGAKLKNFSYQINGYKDNKNTNLTANITGAAAYIPEENYLSFNRQMQNGLAFVKVENLEVPAPILHENKLSGYTDNKGRYMVPDAIALNTETINIDINKLPKNITIEEYKKEYYVPFSGAVRVDFKAKPLPYVVNIKGIKSGAIFNIGKDYYVVGENGQTSIDANGKASIPMDNGGVCELDFINTQKEYNCENKGK